jgi:GxxExxY protein
MDWLKEVEEAGKEVLSILGGGYTEDVYEEALAHELRLRKIPYERQRNFEIIYKGYRVGEGRADLILNPFWARKEGEEIVLELKAFKNITESHRRQVQVYMVSLNIDAGAVLTFGDEVLLEIVEKPKRVLDKNVTKPIKTEKGLPTLLKEAAEGVYKYFGVEFIYREKGLEIFPKAIGVEMRLNGIDFSFNTYPILYKHHQVSEYSFDFVFPTGEVAKVHYYKKAEEIDDQEEEMRFYLNQFKLNRGYLIGIPSKEGNKVLLRVV